MQLPQSGLPLSRVQDQAAGARQKKLVGPSLQLIHPYSIIITMQSRSIMKVPGRLMVFTFVIVLTIDTYINR